MILRDLEYVGGRRRAPLVPSAWDGGEVGHRIPRSEVGKRFPCSPTSPILPPHPPPPADLPLTPPPQTPQPPTRRPSAGRAGEVAGKSSNTQWAFREARRHFADMLVSRDPTRVFVSVGDADASAARRAASGPQRELARLVEHGVLGAPPQSEGMLGRLLGLMCGRAKPRGSEKHPHRVAQAVANFSLV